MSLKEKLKAMHDELTDAITAELNARDTRHVTKLGLARIEIREVITCLEREERGHASQFQYSDAG
ncbi:hypothetical protein D3C75_359480 [compost metagenome]